MATPAYFRVFFWQKISRVFSLPAILAMLAYSPISDGWSLPAWAGVVVVLAAGYGAYLVQAWLRSDVRIDGEGVTLYHGGTWQTWPHETLRAVRRAGRFRVRMYFDGGDADPEPVAADLLRPEAFVAALLERYQASQGHPLPDGGSARPAAA